MPFAAGKMRVLIATTKGPVEVQLLTEEDAAIGRCVACIGGTTETADIASAYHAFVVRPTGVIEARFGHSCYRLDVSGRIDAGSSWQLGVLAAHALLAAGRLAQENDVADAVLWATGSVRPVDLTVGAVDHVPEKLANSLDRLKQERAAGRAVLVAVPAGNLSEASSSAAKDLLEMGAELVAVPHAQTLLDALEMKLPEPASKGASRASDILAVPKDPASAKAPRRIHLWAAAVALIGVIAAGTLALTRMSDIGTSSSQPSQEASRTITLPVDQSTSRTEGVALVPETIPFITTRDRQRIRNEYLTAPNYKALAMTLFEVTFVSGMPSQEAADKAVVETCEKLKRRPRKDSPLAQAEARCDLYASGNVVVTRRHAPVMPPMPWINPPVRRPLVTSEIPMSSQQARQTAVNRYVTRPRSKALVLSPGGTLYWTSSQTAPDEAMRRGLERCGYISKTACLLVAVDDTFVIPVPTLARAVGFYRRDAISGMQPDARADVARQLASATEGWNAVAVGAIGRAGIKVGAASEREAVDGAMEDCAKQDRDCHIAVIGPFLVDIPLANSAQPTR